MTNATRTKTKTRRKTKKTCLSSGLTLEERGRRPVSTSSKEFIMRHSTQASIVALSFSMWDLLAVGQIDHLRFLAMRRGANRVRTLRTIGRAIRSKSDAVLDLFFGVIGYVTSSSKAGYTAVTTRVGRMVNRVLHVGRIIGMYASLFGLVFTFRKRAKLAVSRKANVCPVVETSVPVDEIPETVKTGPVPSAAQAVAIPMPAACRRTEQTVEDRATMVKKAKALIKAGKSQRATAKELEIPISSLRRWLGK